jgi:hypothetical protein
MYSRPFEAPRLTVGPGVPAAARLAVLSRHTSAAAPASPKLPDLPTEATIALVRISGRDAGGFRQGGLDIGSDRTLRA